MKTYTITEAEKNLLEAAKRTCKRFGYDGSGVITANDEKSRQVAENALIEQLKLGTIKIDGIEVKDFTNEDSPHESLKNQLTCKFEDVCGNYPNSIEYTVFLKDFLIYKSQEFESKEQAEIHFVFFMDALDHLLEDRNINKQIDVATYEIIEFDKNACDIPERYIEGLNSEELLTTLMTRYGITWKDFINSDKGSSWGWFNLPNGGYVSVKSNK